LLQTWNWKPAVRNREGWRRKIDRPWPKNRMKRHRRRRIKKKGGGGEGGEGGGGGGGGGEKEDDDGE